MLALPLDNLLEQFKAVCRADGLQGALRFLNGRTGHRFTAVYRLDGAMIQNIALFDRLGKSTLDTTRVPLTDSFCQFVVALDQPGSFQTTHSDSDSRVNGHAKQGVLNAYVGLPLSRKPGTIYGTLCHFDAEAMELPAGELALFEVVGPVLMDHLD